MICLPSRLVTVCHCHCYYFDLTHTNRDSITQLNSIQLLTKTNNNNPKSQVIAVALLRWAPGYYKLTAKMKSMGVDAPQPTGQVLLLWHVFFPTSNFQQSRVWPGLYSSVAVLVRSRRIRLKFNDS